MYKVNMTREAREARNAYMREWRRKNREKVKEQRVRHWERVAERNRVQEDNTSKDDIGTGNIKINA